jgi:hypothetical protein
MREKTKENGIGKHNCHHWYTNFPANMHFCTASQLYGEFGLLHGRRHDVFSSQFKTLMEDDMFYFLPSLKVLSSEMDPAQIRLVP